MRAERGSAWSWLPIIRSPSPPWLASMLTLPEEELERIGTLGAGLPPAFASLPEPLSSKKLFIY